MKKVYFLAPALALLMMNCERAEEPEPDPTPTLSAIQSDILDLNCAISGCHIGNTPPRGLNLEDGNTHTNTVNVNSDAQPAVLLISPGNPEESYLYLKIIDDPSITGNRMPLGRGPLSNDEVDQIREWILEGALDN